MLNIGNRSTPNLVGWGRRIFYRFKRGLRSTALEHPSFRHSGRSDKNPCMGSSLEDVDARESVASWFSQGQRSRRPNYRRWLSEGHVTAMEDSP